MSYFIFYIYITIFLKITVTKQVKTIEYTITKIFERRQNKIKLFSIFIL